MQSFQLSLNFDALEVDDLSVVREFLKIHSDPLAHAAAALVIAVERGDENLIFSCLADVLSASQESFIRDGQALRLPTTQAGAASRLERLKSENRSQLLAALDVEEDEFFNLMDRELVARKTVRESDHFSHPKC